MKYEVDLPADVERRLSDKASRTGQDVVHLIQVAVIQFVDDEPKPVSNNVWSDDLEARRSDLIDKDIAGHRQRYRASRTRSSLDRLANEHFDTIAAPPMEGARHLHQQLVLNRGSRQ